MEYGKKSPRKKAEVKPIKRGAKKPSGRKTMSAEERIRNDMRAYRKRVLQAPGRALD